jgi:hypothetical protein
MDHPMALALAALALLVSPAAAAAQDAPPTATEDASTTQAREHFRVAMDHYNAGRFAEAATEFQRSYDLSHRPELLHNIYLSRRDMGDIAGAVDALRLYLTEATIPEADRTTLVHRLRGMESSLGRAPSPTPVAPTPTVDPTPSEGAPASEPEVEPTPPEADAHTLLASPTPPASSNDLAVAGWVLTASALAPAILAAVGGGTMIAERDGLYAACNAGASGTECPASVDVNAAVSRFETDRALMWTGVGLGAAMLATGIILVIAGQPAAESASTAMCTSDGCVATVRVRL